MPKTGKRNIEHLNARIPAIEMELLRRYCEQSQRTQTDVIREFIRSLQATAAIAENSTTSDFLQTTHPTV